MVARGLGGGGELGLGRKNGDWANDNRNGDGPAGLMVLVMARGSYRHWLAGG